eukprot:m.312383 g.312383  ORF g.312383 m.312383 type:complete len:86 (+) comp255945_c0_seq1:312-569(+)
MGYRREWIIDDNFRVNVLNNPEPFSPGCDGTTLPFNVQRANANVRDGIARINSVPNEITSNDELHDAVNFYVKMVLKTMEVINEY